MQCILSQEGNSPFLSNRKGILGGNFNVFHEFDAGDDPASRCQFANFFTMPGCATPPSSRKMSVHALTGDENLEETVSYIDEAIAAWLASVRGISDSAPTEKAYRRTITEFRARLQAKGRDLDLMLWAQPTEQQAWRRATALFTSEAEQFVGYLKSNGKRASDSTRAQRLSALFSFYRFALKRGHFDEYSNPIGKLDRPKVQKYGKVPPFETQHIAQVMRGIDRSGPEGLRDYALLIVFLETGRRKTEVASLRWRNVELLSSLNALKSPQDVRLKLNFERVKGGKTAQHILSQPGSAALLLWIASYYEINPLYLDGARPLWVALGGRYVNREIPVPLHVNGIDYICNKRLGTSHVHRLRHTFAQQLAEAEMSLMDIAELLGHSSLQTLMVYLKSLNHTGENSKIAELDRVFGIV